MDAYRNSQNYRIKFYLDEWLISRDDHTSDAEKSTIHDNDQMFEMDYKIGFLKSFINREVLYIDGVFSGFNLVYKRNEMFLRKVNEIYKDNKIALYQVPKEINLLEQTIKKAKRSLNDFKKRKRNSKVLQEIVNSP